MMSTSSTSACNALTAGVVVQDPIVRSLLVKTLRECRIPASEWTIEGLGRALEKPHVLCTGPSAATAVLGLSVPTVIVTRGVRVSDEAWAELSRRRPVVIRHVDLTPATLLQGLLRARFGIDFSHVPAPLSRMPPALLQVFLHSPRAARTIGEFSCASGFTPDALRAVEKDLGCRRFEALVTRLRADVYKWLVRAGVDRTVVEGYLGIEDRSNFRRACRRARITPPWRR